MSYKCEDEPIEIEFIRSDDDDSTTEDEKETSDDDETESSTSTAEGKNRIKFKKTTDFKHIINIKPIYYNTRDVETPNLNCEVLTENTTTPILTRGTTESAGYDLSIPHTIKIKAGETQTVNTGLHLKLPKSVMGMIVPRSGISIHTPIQVITGVIDEDYRGEIKIMIYNRSKKQEEIKKLSRLAQLLFIPIVHPTLTVNAITKRDKCACPKKRGKKGFGSTGIF